MTKEFKKEIKNKYKVLKVDIGKFDYDTLFVEVEGVEYQIPISKKANTQNNILNKEIVIDNLFTPLDEIIRE